MPDGTIQYYKDAMGRAMVSTDYDPTSSYAVGDYCIYDNVRYCCNTAIGSGGETWNSAHWDVAKVDDDITEIKSSLTELDTKIIIPTTGSCNIRTARSNISSASGTYYKIDKLVIMTGSIVYTGSQTNQGNMYIDENTFPFLFKLGSIMGIGISNNVNIDIKSSGNNNNSWLTINSSQINATNGNISGKTLVYTLVGVMN